MSEPKPSKRRPIDLARPYGLSAQAIRNYERDGFLPPAVRSPTGYRHYTDLHAAALAAYLAQVTAHGYAQAADIMRAINAGNTEAAFTAIDRSHALLQRDRETLNAVEAAITTLTAAPPEAPQPGGPAQPGGVAQPGGEAKASGQARQSGATLTKSGALSKSGALAESGTLPVGAVAHRLGVRPATLRKWERAGVLQPVRERATGHRVYGAADVRDAELAHLLRRGGYRLDHIAEVVRQVRGAGGTEALAASLRSWRERLTARGRAMLTAAARLSDYLDSLA